MAVSNARLHARERATAAELAATNEALAETVTTLQRSMDIHQRLTRVAVSGEGQPGIAKALHELTGMPVAIEDRYGNLTAWAGPGQPDPYPKESFAKREHLLRRLMRASSPTRDGERLILLASPRTDVMGVLALIDPGRRADPADLVALEHGATVLSMELARLRGIADAELRLRRDLVHDLLAGTDDESALTRAEALDYDLRRPHRVVIVEGKGRARAHDALLQRGPPGHAPGPAGRPVRDLVRQRRGDHRGPDRLGAAAPGDHVRPRRPGLPGGGRLRGPALRADPLPARGAAWRCGCRRPCCPATAPASTPSSASSGCSRPSRT